MAESEPEPAEQVSKRATGSSQSLPSLNLARTAPSSTEKRNGRFDNGRLLPRSLPSESWYSSHSHQTPRKRSTSLLRRRDTGVGIFPESNMFNMKLPLPLLDSREQRHSKRPDNKHHSEHHHHTRNHHQTRRKDHRSHRHTSTRRSEQHRSSTETRHTTTTQRSRETPLTTSETPQTQTPTYTQPVETAPSTVATPPPAFPQAQTVPSTFIIETSSSTTTTLPTVPTEATPGITAAGVTTSVPDALTTASTSSTYTTPTTASTSSTLTPSTSLPLTTSTTSLSLSSTSTLPTLSQAASLSTPTPSPQSQSTSSRQKSTTTPAQRTTTQHPKGHMTVITREHTTFTTRVSPSQRSSRLSHASASHRSATTSSRSSSTTGGGGVSSGARGSGSLSGQPSGVNTPTIVGAVIGSIAGFVIILLLLLLLFRYIKRRRQAAGMQSLNDDRSPTPTAAAATGGSAPAQSSTPAMAFASGPAAGFIQRFTRPSDPPAPVAPEPRFQRVSGRKLPSRFDTEWDGPTSKDFSSEAGAASYPSGSTSYPSGGTYASSSTAGDGAWWTGVPPPRENPFRDPTPAFPVPPSSSRPEALNRSPARTPVINQPEEVARPATPPRQVGTPPGPVTGLAPRDGRFSPSTSHSRLRGTPSPRGSFGSRFKEDDM